MHSIIDAPAVVLAAAIRRRELSPVEVVEAHILRTLEVNPALNAVVVPRFEAALVEAAAAERKLMRVDPDELPPLHGVPFTVKENIAVAGMPWTAGLVSRVGQVAARDATAVERMRRAGAILLGSTNLPELALWFETHNKVYGRTCNPHDTARTCGGSSGGEAAILSAGGSPMGLGSDAGGSIRVPAAFCGVFGHKPSGRLVPGTGHLPHISGSMARVAQIGPMGRSVADLHQMLAVLQGPDGVDSATLSPELLTGLDLDLGRLRVFFADGPAVSGVSGDVAAAVVRAAAALAEQGAQTGEWVTNGLLGAAEMWAASINSHATLTFSEQTGLDRRGRLIWELITAPFGVATFTAATLAVAVVEGVASRLKGPLSRWAQQRELLGRQLLKTLGHDGVLIAPVFPEVAPRHNHTFLHPLGGAMSALFNALEAPATVVPAGFDAQGMPLAVQVVGAPGNDGLCLRVAAELERALGGWRRATPPTRQLTRRLRRPDARGLGSLQVDPQLLPMPPQPHVQDAFSR